MARRIGGRPSVCASTARHSWHFYGLAVDVISRRTQWDDPAFFRAIAVHLKAAGLDWGGDWSTPDLPHFHWGTLKASPSARARELYATGGREALWREVGAL